MFDAQEMLQMVEAGDATTIEEVEFCLEHWDPRASSGKHVTKNQAYFTPLPLALDAGKYMGDDDRLVVDISADIGRLAYGVLCVNWWDVRHVRITAVELNPEYVAVGGRLLPEVTWVQFSMRLRMPETPDN